MSGNLSEAMLLAAEVEAAGEATGGLLVRTLVPPAGSEPGDQLYLLGGQPSTDTPKAVRLNVGWLGGRVGGWVADSAMHSILDFVQCETCIRAMPVIKTAHQICRKPTTQFYTHRQR
jgi:hypothetical protein